MLAAVAVALLAGCGGSKGTEPPPARAGIQVTSPAFDAGAPLPKRFTCDGEDLSPPLRWSGVPAAAASLAIVVDDPDAPGGSFNHWTVFAIDPRAGGVAAGSVPPGTHQATNSNGDDRYTGPCPPSGEDPHHYRFVVYALRRRPDLRAGVPAKAALAAIGADAIAEGRLTGTYGR